MKRIISIILMLLCLMIVLCGCKFYGNQTTKEIIANAQIELDFRNTDDENLQCAVRVVKSIYEEGIEVCYKAKELEYPTPNIDENRPIKDFYKFRLKNDETVIVGALSELVLYAIKPYDSEDFYYVYINNGNCYISDEIYGQ